MIIGRPLWGIFDESSHRDWGCDDTSVESDVVLVHDSVRRLCVYLRTVSEHKR